MDRVFKETPIFTRRLFEIASDAVLVIIQNRLLENPLDGVLVVGCGGLRKMRVADPKRNKGLRGGLRVIYLDLPQPKITYLLYVYGKDEAEDLSPAERKRFRDLVKILKGG